MIGGFGLVLRMQALHFSDSDRVEIYERSPLLRQGAGSGMVAN